jgi:hypothetical protein
LDIVGTEGAIAAHNAKIAHKREQMNKGLGFMKNQNNELRGILKKITPKLTKSLYKLLENKTPEKIAQLAEAMVGMLRNSREVSNVDVEVSEMTCLRGSE